jgi:hypothetical protein
MLFGEVHLRQSGRGLRLRASASWPIRHPNQHSQLSGETVEIRKRVIPVVLTGGPIGREPKVAKLRAEDLIKLPPHTATMDDCCRSQSCSSALLLIRSPLAY